jgi:hypothetical protein
VKTKNILHQRINLFKIQTINVSLLQRSETLIERIPTHGNLQGFFGYSFLMSYVSASG